MTDTRTLNIITDEEANEIYLRMAAQSSSRKCFIKKNWAEDETKLLKWAVVTYTRQKSINYNNLVSLLFFSDNYRLCPIGKTLLDWFQVGMITNAIINGSPNLSNSHKKFLGLSRRTQC